MSPKYFTPQNIDKIKKYVSSLDDNTKKIFFPADINYDKKYYSELRKIIPELELYDRTKHKLSETINLFQSCDGGI
jgi:tRNA nucleotidyltransferase/poly(A) polymerase